MFGVNVEQFEAALTDATISCYLAEKDCIEKSRSVEVDKHDNLVIRVVAEQFKSVEFIEIDFVVDE